MPQTHVAMKRASVGLALLLVTAGCGDRTGFEKPGSSTSRSRRGDTVFVTTKGDGVWGPAHDAVEEFRVPANSKETTFGQIGAIAATGDGGVLVYDTKAPEGKILRQFDSAGKFVRNIGHEGRGPGEYSGEMMTIAESHGAIVIRDVVARIINRYGPDGKSLGGFSIGHSAGIGDVAVGDDGSIYTAAPRAVARPVQGPPTGQPLFHYDPTGQLLDSVPGKPWLISAASRGGYSPYAAHEIRFALADGRVVVGRTDKLGFLIFDPVGKSPALVAEHTVPPVPYLNDELKQRQKSQQAEVHISVDGERIQNPSAASSIPKFKLPLLTIHGDIDGRIWISTPGPSEKVPERCTAWVDERCIANGSYGQSISFMVFQSDGAFLGEIRFPKRTAQRAYFGNHAWMIVRDSDDVPTLARFRLNK